jgi:sugar phosphate isomerase/epimerase
VKLALNTGTLGHNIEGMGQGWSPEQVIDACAVRDIRGVVFWRRELKGRAHQIGEYARKAGLTLPGLCRLPLLTGREAAPDRDIEAAIHETAELGADVLTIVTGGVEPATKGTAAAVLTLTKRLSHFAPIAQAAGVKLALEPLHPLYAANRSCVLTAREGAGILKDIGHPNLGLAIDVWHVWWDRTLAQSLEDTQVFGLHLCDWLHDTTDMLTDRGMMGDGVADVAAIRKAVHATGYQGFEEVEVFSANDWWKRDPGDVLDVITDRCAAIEHADDAA